MKQFIQNRKTVVQWQTHGRPPNLTDQICCPPCWWLVSLLCVGGPWCSRRGVGVHTGSFPVAAWPGLALSGLCWGVVCLCVHGWNWMRWPAEPGPSALWLLGGSWGLLCFFLKGCLSLWWSSQGSHAPWMPVASISPMSASGPRRQVFGASPSYWKFLRGNFTYQNVLTNTHVCVTTPIMTLYWLPFMSVNAFMPNLIVFIPYLIKRSLVASY